MANWDVFRELDRLRREVDEAFRGAGFNRPFGSTFLSPAAARRFPLLNLSEDEGHVYIDALAPGVDPKDTDLAVLRNTITISGERKPFVLGQRFRLGGQPCGIQRRAELAGNDRCLGRERVGEGCCESKAFAGQEYSNSANAGDLHGDRCRGHGRDDSFSPRHDLTVARMSQPELRAVLPSTTPAASPSRPPWWCVTPMDRSTARRRISWVRCAAQWGSPPPRSRSSSKAPRASPRLATSWARRAAESPRAFAASAALARKARSVAMACWTGASRFCGAAPTRTALRVLAKALANDAACAFHLANLDGASRSLDKQITNIRVIRRIIQVH